MKNDLFNTEIDEIIRASMKLADEPDPELNNKLKATLYQKEAVMRKQPATRGFSLWYLPMILNLVTFIMLAYIYYAGGCSTNSNQQHIFVLLCCWYLFLHWTGWRFAYHSWCKKDKYERGYNNPC